MRTNYDYNDGCSHIVNFRWGADVNAYHVDGYNISITTGSDPVGYNNFYDLNDMWHTDNANNTRLYWTISDLGLPPPNNQGQQDLPPTDWSIWIDAADETATLYQGPNLTGTALPTMPLTAGSPWYLRFYLMDATSAGYPGTDNYLFLYSYSSAVPAPGICGCGVDDTIGFVGFLPPISGADATGGSFADPRRAFKLGSTIPVKFAASQCGRLLLTGTHTLQAVKYSSDADSDPPIDATPTDAATTGNQFRLTDGGWHFNLSTRTGFSQGTWNLIATLSDGSQHDVWITIKK